MLGLCQWSQLPGVNDFCTGGYLGMWLCTTGFPHMVAWGGVFECFLAEDYFGAQKPTGCSNKVAVIFSPTLRKIRCRQLLVKVWNTKFNENLLSPTRVGVCRQKRKVIVNKWFLYVQLPATSIDTSLCPSGFPFRDPFLIWETRGVPAPGSKPSPNTIHCNSRRSLSASNHASCSGRLRFEPRLGNQTLCGWVNRAFPPSIQENSRA
jgi:hypothetical protein